VAERPRDAGVRVEMSMSIVDLEAITHSRESPNALCALVEREKKSSQVTTSSASSRRKRQQNASDLEGSLVTSSRSEKARRLNIERRCRGTSS